MNGGLAAALGAAFFFGISAPLSKLLLGSVSPLMLAGLLYIGSFAGLTLVTLLRRAWSPARSKEASLKGRDYLYLAGSILAGGIAAPLFLLSGLDTISASSASLLMNLEGVLTVLLAFVMFREHVGRRIWASAFLMLMGGGDPVKLQKGRMILFWTAIAFIIILISRGLPAVFRNLL